MGVEPPGVKVAAGGLVCGFKGMVLVPPIMMSVFPLDVCTAMGVFPVVMVCPGLTVGPSPMMTPPPFEGLGLTTTFEWPALIVTIGRGAGELSPLVSCSCAGGILIGIVGTVSQPVAVISRAGEHPRQGSVMLKFGSGISWWPSGSPGSVVGAGIGWRPSCVEVIPVGRVGCVGTTLVALTGSVPLRDVGSSVANEGEVSSVVGWLEEVFLDGMSPIGLDDIDSVGVGLEGVVLERSVLEGANDGSSEVGRADGIMSEGRGADGMSAVGFLDDGMGADGIKAIGSLDDVVCAEGIRAIGFLDVVDAEGITTVPNARVTPWSEPML